MRAFIHQRRALPGSFWLVACACLFAGMGMSVRQLVSVYRADVFWVAWIRFVIGLLVVVGPALAGHWSLRITNRSAFVLRGLFGVGGMFTLLVVIDKVGLGRGTVLANLTAVFATLLAIPLLKEWPRPVVAVSVALATGGVLLCSGVGVPVGWEWLALLCAFFGGFTLPFIRILRRTDGNHISFLSQCMFGVLLLLPLLSPARFPTSPTIWQLLLLMATFDILGQFCLSQGLATVPVARGTAILMLVPILSLLAGVTLFGESLQARQWVGCGIVLLSGFLAVMARRTPRPQAEALPAPEPMNPMPSTCAAERV